jgi:hypothetical protein
MKKIFWMVFLIFLLVFLSSCTVNDVQPTAQSQADMPMIEPEKHVRLTFNVHVPLNTPSDQPIYLYLLDEVTGSSINSTIYRFPASGEDLYTISINVPLDSVVMYRYSNNTNTPEVDYQGNVVAHRIVHCYQHTVVEDTIVGWNGQAPYEGNLGRLSGIISDDAQRPLEGIVVSVAGMETTTGSDGSYEFEFLPIGTHNLVAYTPDGSYKIFQQQALIGTDLETKAMVVMEATQTVNVAFVVTIPDDMLQAIPVRIVGNIQQLGGYSDVIWDGVGVSAANAPIMTRGADGKHRLEVSLPVGAEIHYKYTLGDSIWSAEQGSEGIYLIRRLLVPDQDLVVEDTVQTWNNSGFGTISLITFVPEELRQGDIWIQFRYGQDWMEPMPMWATGEEGKWFAILSSPLNDFVNIKYRYCLNGDCDQYPETNQDGYLIQRNLEILPEIQNIEDELLAWRVVEP